MAKFKRRSVYYQSLHHTLVQLTVALREHWQHLATRVHRHPARTAAAAPGSQTHAVDAHDHAAMLVRWQHWLAWLEAQRLEVEQRMAARAVDAAGEEDTV